MGVEQVNNQDVISDVYAQISSSDDTPGELTQDEKSELVSNYEKQCEEIKDETCSSLKELKKVMDIFEESTKIPKEDMKKIQMLIGIPKGNSRDGVFGPNSMDVFEKYIKETSFQGSLQELSTKYEEAKTYFNSLGDKERKALQPSGGKDGHFGPSTFKHILTQSASTPTAKVKPEEVTGEKTKEVTEEVTVVKTEQPKTPEPKVKETSQTPGNHPAEKDIEVKEKLTDAEKIDKFKHQASSIPKTLIKFLQASVNTGADGDFGSGSAKAVISKYPDAQSLEEVMKIEGIPMKSDGVLPIRENTPESQREVFRELYGEYVDTLADNLKLPKGLIEAIIRQETHFGTYGGLKSHSGCKGMMQLSGVGIKDMKTEYRGNIRNYKDSFKNLDLDSLMSLEVGDTNSTIKETIPSEIVDTLYALKSGELSNSEHNSAIQKLQDFIKNDASYFNHAVNMILGSVILSGIYHGETKGDNEEERVTKTADLYNAAAGERKKYRSEVTKFYREYNKEKT